MDSNIFSNDESQHSKLEYNEDVSQERNEKSKSNISNITNKYVKDLVKSTGLNLKTYKELNDEKSEKASRFKNNQDLILNVQQRKWLSKHGKEHLIDFTDKDLRELKGYFKQLDEEKKESIGINQLETPLMSLGIAENAEDVKKIISTVDKDGSGQIEFGEFLSIIKAKNDGVQNNSALITFFKDMIGGNLAGGKISKNLPFQMVFDIIRRRKFMEATLAVDLKTKEEGEKVRKCFEKKLPLKKILTKYDSKK